VMWMTPIRLELPGRRRRATREIKPVAGWSPEADARAQPEVVLVTLLMAAATVFFGIVPSPLFNLAHDVGSSLNSLL
jgi:hypothetical protein